MFISRSVKRENKKLQEIIKQSFFLRVQFDRKVVCPQVNSKLEIEKYCWNLEIQRKNLTETLETKDREVSENSEWKEEKLEILKGI